MKFYYGIGSKKVMASPANWGEKDPIIEFAKQLRQSNDKDNWRLAKKLDAKTRIFAPVIVRGEEAEGVKLWQFGKEIYEAFLQLAADEEVGDFTDILNGRDIKLNTVGPESTGTPYNRTTIGPSMKTSALSDDAGQSEKWLEDQPDPKKVFKPLSYDDMKTALQEWLSPEGDDEEDSIVSEPAEGFDSDVKETPKSNYSLSTKPAVKETKADKFDKLFEEEDDDLPF
jgi:succinate dehydrogenase flavin-adding protein (antitoxin of CptAB toxin-antitoxin module)